MPYILHKHVIKESYAYEVDTAHFPKQIRFQVLSMRAIDFPHKVTPREVISKEKKLKKFLKKIHVK